MRISSLLKSSNKKPYLSRHMPIINVVLRTTPADIDVKNNLRLFIVRLFLAFSLSFDKRTRYCTCKNDFFFKVKDICWDHEISRVQKQQSGVSCNFNRTTLKNSQKLEFLLSYWPKPKAKAEGEPVTRNE